MRRLSISTGLLLALIIATVEAADSELFPLPDTLRPAVAFWVRVYTEVDSNAGYIHDSRNLNIVYQALKFKTYSNPRQQKKEIEKAIQRYRTALKALAAGKRKGLNDDEKKVFELWGASAGSERLSTAAKDLRFQRGQADRLRSGVIHSGAWEKEILETLSNTGLPHELAVIPHIESSYNPKVRSPAGAVGLWQFTRRTGTKFLQIDHVVDERLDPLRSTEAAAALLKQYYEALNSWPLAITAYNSGVSRVRRAVRETGTEDIGVIVQKYRGRRFGFASRNFYAAFLAVADIAKNTKSYLGTVKRSGPEDYHLAEIPAFMEAKVVAESLSVDEEVLKQLNPALQYSVWNGSKHIPKGYFLKLPSDQRMADVRTQLARLAATQGYKAQIPDTFYKVKSGDTLSAIALRYRISVRELVRLNNLQSRHRIRVGQSLRLPQG